MFAIALSLVLLLALAGRAGAASDVPRTFRNLTSADGLSQNWVRCIYQDDFGFIWFGTADGLNRYDAREIKVYRPRSEGGGLLSGIAVNAFLGSGEGAFWVGTDIGLFRYDAHLDALARVELVGNVPVLALLRDRFGATWIGTVRGLYRFEGDRLDHFVAAVDDAGSLSHGYVNALFEDSAGTLWVGTKDGVNRYDRAAKRFVSNVPPAARGTGAGGDFFTFAEDASGRLWAGATRRGVHLVDREARKEVVLRAVMPGRIIDLLVDRRDRLWIARAGNEGLGLLDLRTYNGAGQPVLEEYFHDPARPKTITDNSIFSLFEDRSGDIWIGTFGRGVSYYSDRAKPIVLVNAEEGGLVSNLVNAFAADAGTLWVGTENGLERIDRKTGAMTHFTYRADDPASLASDTILALLADSRGDLWCGTWAGGLHRYDAATGRIERIAPQALSTDAELASVFALCEDAQGFLWVGTHDDGVFRRDPADGTFHPVPGEPDGAGGFAPVADLLVTGSGEVYVARSHALERFSPQTGRLILLPQPAEAPFGPGGRTITVLETDSRDHLWVGTNSGLERFFPESGQYEASFAGVFADQAILSLLEDDFGNLWVATSEGLHEVVGGAIDPERAQVRIVTRPSDLTFGGFKPRAAHRGSDGRLYFGTSSGYLHFRPEAVRFNEEPPVIALSDLQILDSAPDRNAFYRPLGRNPNFEPSIELEYDQNDFTVRFSALNYLNPESNRFKYRLVGYDTDWIDSPQGQSATYTSIDPGHYAFEVMGTNNDGVWSLAPRSLAIHVRSPWWGTPWFRLLVLAAIGLALFSTYRLRVSMLHRQKRLLRQMVDERTAELAGAKALAEEKQVEIEAQNKELSRHRENLEKMIEERTRELRRAKLRAEESDRLKSAFLANLSHEIRTPMNAVVGYASLLHDLELEDPDLNEYISVIDENCQTLLVLIDDILDLSAIDSNQIRIRQTVFSVNAVFEDLRRDYEKVVGTKPGIHFVYENEGERTRVDIFSDLTRMKQILHNLLNNAVKFTERGTIRFGFAVTGSELQCYVADSGPGIEPEEAARIFDRFYKVDDKPDKLHRGTGLGLSISRELALLLGGGLTVESEPGRGSTFWLTLPGVRPPEERRESPARSERPDLSGLTVLVAEDEETNFRLAETILSSAGATVVRAHHGAEAVDYVRTRSDPHDLVVLMDLKMPIMDGFEACRQIRALAPGLPVVALTAFALSDQEERIREASFDAFLRKPTGALPLLATVKQVAPRDQRTA